MEVTIDVNKMRKMTGKDEYKSIALFYDIIFGPLLNGIRRQVINISGVKSNHTVLEVACGTGKQAALFAEKGAIVTGFDLSKAMLKKARQKIVRNSKGDLNFIYGDAANMPFEDNQFDISSISLALHEMKPSIRSQVVKEMIRVTKNDGNIILVDYTRPKESGLLNKFLGLCIKIIERFAGGKHYAGYKDFMKRVGLHYLVREHNLDIVKERPAYSGNIGILKLKSSFSGK